MLSLWFPLGVAESSKGVDILSWFTYDLETRELHLGHLKLPFSLQLRYPCSDLGRCVSMSVSVSVSVSAGQKSMDKT